MRWPRVRFTVRRMMVAVAGVAVVLVLYQRHRTFERLAADHRNAAMIARPIRIISRQPRRWIWMLLPSPYHEREDELARKYERAARYPWLPVEPDPPEPQ